MLILIAGVTGNIGKHAAQYGVSKGHQIRGLGRSLNKQTDDLRNQLESFIVSKTYYDIEALDKAVKGVDAIICAYTGLPELHLDGQLLLLRAAERAGVKIFLAASWNYDWRTIKLGDDAPIYDPIVAFHKQVEITSSIRPLHIFSGMLAEVFFGTEGQAGFTTDYPGGVIGWEDGKRVMNVWGTGDEPWYFTTESDAGKWGIEAVAAADAEQGGFVTVCSWVSTLNELVASYSELRNYDVTVRNLGTVEDLERKAVGAKAASGRRNFWEWHRLWFHLFCVKGTWNLTNIHNDQFPVKPTDLGEFLKTYPEI
ncbi:Isoflavone reductase-like protein [Lachnellula suecica]|uniref:Isoflavone reductase-like protein n=1 Tax=Lachnellula suecica TaxID=602035 RepID=A0A8T9C070_9HELO|nr:Isoflavone reductase-like protein [Lachnellula suecica]